MIDRRGIDYVLICPGLSESTIYSSQAKDGFYSAARRGPDSGLADPDSTLPKNSPYRMWRVAMTKTVAATGPQAP